ncbi:short-chain dehydrogenase [bacterium (Candidatus Blackallbacteria) CG17_big_fil_post_rev_8_21_14_2_50_48_46]|uniref:Short-chain dehydrogenase n=1 Tax=bacterium (Candidatus Blackallbacteria) CG17_big_fil_post_rev_8_21_14_2_50_48_46 TaxID=2014261 RepID=A0A2M7G0Z8_9BACT|nr:MAG: short-chain dehydrogenase [bacterium (Candidatus Blackallbacteria) CG18_big_fil_WC_8_21_14_2_50_49_26]PIW15316.1 MAG: short-chain dehydrogenase [bacterium (Candidatus Blackallbacteria) CG17_big_fil_post_rev_8_21_14_2_50_48_46]PIW45174.1 MAG: short-chain dehydrogenase [bacterium (Candidatus Blackallbacteria) CG13_big_fil_rev_8_21_14_2_50_49_14]
MSLPKRVFVSGGSKGIGLAIAQRFLAEGFQVAVSASSSSSLEALKAQSPEMKTYLCDMSSKEAVLDLAERLNQEWGPLDVLVNNVGRFMPGQMHSEEDQIFEYQMQLNLNSIYYLTKRVLPPMIAQRSGTIFNICSTASITAYPNGGSYCISKFALLGFSKILREEMKAHQIRVISVLPGATLTASWEGVDLPPERFIPAEDIATVVWETYGLSPRTVVEEILVRPLEGDLG